MNTPNRGPAPEIPVETHMGEDSGATDAPSPLDEFEIGTDPAAAGNKPRPTGATVGGEESGAGRGAEVGNAGATASADEVDPTTEQQPSPPPQTSVVSYVSSPIVMRHDERSEP